MFEHNILRLERELLPHAGKRKIAIMGQPGSGKSSLLDLLTDGHCQPRPRIGGNTDSTDWSEDDQVQLIYAFKDILYVDVPGYGTSSHPVNILLEFFPFGFFDHVLLLIKGKIHETDERIWNKLRKNLYESRTMVIRNFAENLTSHELQEVYAELWSVFVKKLDFTIYIDF